MQEIACHAIIHVEWLDLYVAIFDDTEQFTTELAALGIDPENDGPFVAKAGWGENQSDHGHLCYQLYPGGDPKLKTIIHECIHTVDHLCELAGIPISVECGEVRTYMTTWLVEKVTLSFEKDTSE